MGLLGTLTGTFATVTLAKRYISKAAEWLNESEMGQNIKETIMEKTDALVGNYVSSLGDEKWNSIIDKNCDTSTLSEEDKARYAELANGFLGMMSASDPDGKWKNLQESINGNPEGWGMYLEQHGMTAETMQDMQQRIANGESISGYDMLKLVTNKGSLTADEKEAEAEQQTMEQSSAEQQTMEQSSAEQQTEEQSSTEQSTEQPATTTEGTLDRDAAVDQMISETGLGDLRGFKALESEQVSM